MWSGLSISWSVTMDFDRLVGSWLVGWLFDWWVRLFLDWLVGRWFRQSLRRLVSYSVGWLVVGMIGLLVG